MPERDEGLSGAAIAGLVTVNGVRVSTGDGTWGLVWASSNKPGLVIVEGQVSRATLEEMFRKVDGARIQNTQVRAHDQSKCKRLH